MTKLFGKVLCALGFHRFGAVEEGCIRSTGKYQGVEEFFFQKGLSLCLRDDCSAKKRVWRSGWVGGDRFRPNRWVKTDPSMETIIDPLKPRELMA